MPTTVVSAPGKVLLAGGYLVLDQEYPGLVVATSSRFYTLIQSGNFPDSRIRVRSPQFTGAEWNYQVDLQGSSTLVQSIDQASRNKFVELAISKSLLLCSSIQGIEPHMRNGLDIIIVGDNDFYSSREKLESLGLPSTVNSLESLEPFLHLDCPIAEAHKTGLGSSAALTSSLVVGLLCHLGVLSPEDFSQSVQASKGLKLAHNLSQYTHCLAQGKVGSGFDVSSAIYGSQVYRRFNPEVLKPLMNDESKVSMVEVLSAENLAWNSQVNSFRLPPYTRLLLADVEAGSDTPSLVGRVLKWRQSNPEEALIVWQNLNDKNQELTTSLNKVSALFHSDQQSYCETMKKLSCHRASQWNNLLDQTQSEAPIIHALYEAHRVTEDIRRQIRKMGHLADVPIEPDEQTGILDETIALPGVIGGGVPGAGGYDALWVLLIGVEGNGVLSRVENLWSQARVLRVTPLRTSEGSGEGVRMENAKDVPGLDAIMSSAGWEVRE